MEFADHYKWYFVQECQLNHISNKECNVKWATLEVVAKKTDLNQTKTFTEWKEYFYAMVSNPVKDIEKMIKTNTWEDSLEQEEIMYNLENNLYSEDYTKQVKELLDKYKE